MNGKVRPQILAGIVLLGLLGGIAMYLDYAEVATASVAGIVALGMQLVEKA